MVQADGVCWHASRTRQGSLGWSRYDPGVARGGRAAAAMWAVCAECTWAAVSDSARCELTPRGGKSCPSDCSCTWAEGLDHSQPILLILHSLCKLMFGGH